MNYHALPPLTLQTGERVEAVHGFVGSVIKVVREQKPDYCVVCFDRGETLWRRKEYSEYKADHGPMDSELYEQWPIVYEAAKVFGIERYEMPGYEADDLIGTLSRMAEEMGHEVIIYSYDADMYQLVTDNVRVLNPKGFVTPDGVMNKFGLTPSQIPDWKALVGDPSDNVPHLFGEVSSRKLLQQYGTIQGIYDNIKALPKVQVEKLAKIKDALFLNLRLVTIVRNLPIIFPERLHTIDYNEVLHFLKRMEFRTMLGRFEHYWKQRGTPK
jgi:DNA polymerase-1